MSEPLPRLTKEQEDLVRTSTVVPRLARRMSRRTAYLTEDELKSVGYESECRCAARFEPTRKVPFEAYSYTVVHLDMRKAIGKERTKQRREVTGTLDASYEYLERYRDPGDLFSDTEADSRRQLREFAEGIMGAVLAQFLSEASRAPTEDDLQEHGDRERKRARVRSALEAIGQQGRVLALRYLEGLPWEDVAARLGASSATVRRDHDAAVRLLVARMRSRRSCHECS